jgi:hypothetical protein
VKWRDCYAKSGDGLMVSNDPEDAANGGDRVTKGRLVLVVPAAAHHSEAMASGWCHLGRSIWLML